MAFFGLRKHDILNGIPVTELVYVHSKLMIVDDSQVRLKFTKSHLFDYYCEKKLIIHLIHRNFYLI